MLGVLLLMVALSACSYHPRDSVKKPSSRPLPRKQPSDDLVLREAPTEPRTLQKKIIVIDPGHGGDDYGTRSASKPKYHEKSLNLATALLLSEYLQKMGYQTFMTRSTDEFISLQKRAELANDREADLFISVHYNSAPAKEAEGVEIFYYKSDVDKSRSSESRQLATAILGQIIKLTEAKSRGVKHGNFAVIRETKMPAVLIEGGFLTNEEEMEKIKNPAYVRSLAWGIASGVQNYLKL